MVAILRTLLSAAAGMLLLASGARGQLQGSCPNGDDQETCAVTTMSSSNPLAAPSTTLTVSFIYCAPQVSGTGLAYGTGPIISVSTGTLSVQGTSGPATGYRVASITGSITTAPNAAAVPGTVLINSFSSGTTLTVISPSGTSSQVGLTSNTPFVYSNGVTLSSSLVTVSTLPFVTTADCGDVSGDPLFTGFKGQQFYVGGEDGQVMNMISTFNMQLNGRFVTLEAGQAITPDAQKAVRLASEVRHQAEPSVAAFPDTVAWSHPGNYFGEVGVALLDENRLYAKAGSYERGFAKVALNGRPLAVSDEFVVLGAGANTTYIQRVSAHELMVRTVNVEFTVTNSDNFLNVEHVHLEKGFRQHNRFGGLLGKTVDGAWKWNKADEEQAVVQSNDLFAKEQ